MCGTDHKGGKVPAHEVGGPLRLATLMKLGKEETCSKHKQGTRSGLVENEHVKGASKIGRITKI